MRPPSPPAPPLLGHLPGFRSDVLGLLTQSVREHGDLLRFRLGSRSIYLVNHPEAITQVLKTRARNYNKDTRTTAFLRDITGESLLTSNGEEWAKRRHLFQPTFHRKVVEGFESIMREEADALVRNWQGRDQVQADSAMMNVTFRVVARALFGSDLPDEIVRSLEQPIGLVLEETFARHGTFFGWRTRRFQSAMRELDTAIAQILAQARPTGESPDLLTVMRAAHTSEQDIRNEAITFLLAGHETTANALTWLLAYLAHDPDEQERCAADPEALDRAIQETLRLSPPIWIIERKALAKDEVAGFTIPRGASVVVCPYTVHRHPDFWDRPEEFDPSRFARKPPAAYLPFGLGPRLCIGREFSLLEARIIAAAILQAFKITPTNPGFPETRPGITLRVEGGLPLNLRPRHAS